MHRQGFDTKQGVLRGIESGPTYRLLVHASLPSSFRRFQRSAHVQVSEPRMFRQRMARETKASSSSDIELSVSVSDGNSTWQLVPLANAEVKQAVDVSQRGTVFGSSSSADVRIASADREHVKVTWTEEGPSLANLRDGKEYRVEDRTLRPGESTILRNNDLVVVGDIQFLAKSFGEECVMLQDGNFLCLSVQGAQSASTTKQSEEDGETGSLLSQGRGIGSPQAGLAMEYGHWALSLGILYYSNKLLAQATAAAGIAFPSPLIGMFLIIGVLLVLSQVAPSASDRLSSFFSPALDWIQRWLPLFYVPPLVVLPLSVQGIPGSALLRILVVILVGMPASLLFTAAVAKTIRQLTNTELEPTQPSKASAPFTRGHHIAWSAVAAFSLAAAAFGPSQWATTLVIPFMLAATVEGLLVGSAIPKAIAKFVHPLLTCGLIANFGAALYAAAIGWPYKEALRLYLTKAAGGAALGGGDYLMSFLGVVILSFGFRIFGQRRLMVHHAPEIFGSTTLSAAFSLFGTAAFARALGLAPDIARALAPRSVTVALALPIAAQLHAPASITAAGVALTGLLGSNTVQLLLNAFGYKDPIARGLATAGASHGLGTAALAGKEPEALPFCALAYALIGIISTVLASIPVVQAALLAVTG